MLPNPENYDSWRDYARALNQVIGDSGIADNVVAVRYTEGTGGGSIGPGMPEGFKMVWYSPEQAKLFLSNPAYDPPVAEDLFRIDTAQIAEAAISTQKLKDGAVDFYKIFDGAVGTQKLADLVVTNAKIADLAVGTSKILDATIVTAKIADATIVSALIGDAQIVSAKIADLAVNSAHIANAAITSAKIANLSVGAALIQDGAVINAKIGNQITSYDWNSSTKQGWSISKDGGIEGNRVTIYNPDGSIAFASGINLQLTGVNYAMNSNFARGLAGIRVGPGADLGLNYPGYFGKRQVAYLHAVDLPAGGTADVAGPGFWITRSVEAMRKYDLPVKQGDRIAGRMLAGNHRSIAQMYLLVFDKDGLLLEAPQSSQGAIPGGGQGGDNLGTVQLIWDIGNPNAAYAGWMIRMAEDGGSDEYVFFTEIWFGKLAAGQTTIPPYSPGPSDILATQGATWGVDAYGFGVLAGQNSVDVSQTTGFGILATLNSIAPGNTTGFGVLATRDLVQLGVQGPGGVLDESGTFWVNNASVVTSQGTAADFVGRGSLARQNAVDLATQIYGALPNFSYISGNLDRSRTLGFGSLSAIDFLDAGNISTYIAGAAIGRALIANAAIGTANIDNAAITSALIADAAILSAKIADAQIGNAKITDVSANKMRTGLLTGGAGNNYWDLDAGRIVQQTGGVRMVMGTAFGAAGNLMRWFGPTGIGAGAETIANSIWAEATDGKIYYGGQELGSTGGGSIAVQIPLNSGTASSTNEITQGQVGATIPAGGKFRISAKLRTCISNTTGTTSIIFRFYVNYGGGNQLIASASVFCDNGGGFDDSNLQSLGSELYANPGSGAATILVTAAKLGGAGAGSASFTGGSIIERINAV